jgi:hypothetical protein
VYEKSRNSLVSIATDYGLDDWMIGVRIPAGAGNFPLRHRVQTGSEARPASYPMITGAPSLGVKRQGREADHSRSKNAWSYTSTPQYALMAWCLVKKRDNFTFTLYIRFNTLINI